MKMRRQRIAFLLLFFVLGCMREKSAPTREMAVASPPPGPASGEQTRGYVNAKDAEKAAGPLSAAVSKPTRMIIRTAQVSLVVSDTAATMDKLTALAQAFGGYVNDTKVWRDGEQL